MAGSRLPHVEYSVEIIMRLFNISYIIQSSLVDCGGNYVKPRMLHRLFCLVICEAPTISEIFSNHIYKT